MLYSGNVTPDPDKLRAAALAVLDSPPATPEYEELIRYALVHLHVGLEINQATEAAMRERESDLDKAARVIATEQVDGPDEEDVAKARSILKKAQRLTLQNIARIVVAERLLAGEEVSAEEKDDLAKDLCFFAEICQYVAEEDQQPE